MTTPEFMGSRDYAPEHEGLMRADEQWFIDHPDRWWFVRPTHPTEPLGPIRGICVDCLVVVVRIAPGVRVRGLIGDASTRRDQRRHARRIRRTYWDYPYGPRWRGSA